MYLPSAFCYQGTHVTFITNYLCIRVAKPSQMYFGGNVRGESAMKTEEEVGSLIEYEFRVRKYYYQEIICLFI